MKNGDHTNGLQKLEHVYIHVFILLQLRYATTFLESLNFNSSNVSLNTTVGSRRKTDGKCLQQTVANGWISNVNFILSSELHKVKIELADTDEVYNKRYMKKKLVDRY